MTTVVVLGAEGFLGRHFSRYAETTGLAAEPIRVVRVDREIGSGPDRHRLDVTDARGLETFLCSAPPDAIVNFVAASGDDSALLTELNVELPARLMELLSGNPAFPATRLLLVGSAAEYGSSVALPYSETTPLCPLTAYGRSKRQQYERFAAATSASDLDVSLARPFNIVGPGMPSTLSVQAFAERLRRAPVGGALRAGNLSAVRDFLDVDDVIMGLWAILTSGRPRQVYNVCSGVGVSMRTVVEIMISLSGKALTIDEDHDADPGVVASVGTAAKLTSDTGWRPHWTLERSLAKLLSAG
jgi:GDP-4-dehydro-6-deoxy-D-mannose reductase